MVLQAYSAVEDLLLGDIPASSTISQEKYVQDAADEIDSKLGFIYQTPMDLTAAPRPVKLLLKRINNFLATGRYIMAVASPIEQSTLHAYGQSLVRGATSSLESIINGDITLESVPVVAGEALAASVPLISNVDPESSVEAFYDRVANPNYTYPYFGSGPYGGLAR